MDFPEDVSGWLEREEGECLAGLAKDKTVLEIGSYHGRSTICLARTAKRVHAIDWHKGDVYVGSKDTLGDLIGNLERYGVRDKVVLHVGSTKEIGPVLGSAIFDLVFVDGGHDYNCAILDMQLAGRCVRPDGVIVLHDWYMHQIKTAAWEVLGWNPRAGADCVQLKCGAMNDQANRRLEYATA